TGACRWHDVRDDYGATATIVNEYLAAQGVSIGTKLATAIFYAIKSETQDLGREANHPDREAYLRLFPVSNKKLLYEITHPKLPIEYYLTIGNALENTKIYNKVMVANLQKIVFPELVAEMADFLMRLEEIETVLCMGHYNTEMILSIRTVRHDINAGAIIGRLVAGLGKAGGHGMMAGGKIDEVSPTLKAMRKVESVLTARLLAELDMGKVRPRRLVRRHR
ncbi:MAG TPA: DHHA1 domain-containing protein, partial [Geobacteraceae bacterium]|nr:DHHA1 domain-containing protein [Geobacteraceae bacterium]